jgi:hypothetical protein
MYKTEDHDFAYFHMIKSHIRMCQGVDTSHNVITLSSVSTPRREQNRISIRRSVSLSRSRATNTLFSLNILSARKSEEAKCE